MFCWFFLSAVNNIIVLFQPSRISGLKKSPFGQTAMRFAKEHHVTRTPGMLGNDDWTFSCVTEKWILLKIIPFDLNNFMSQMFNCI